MWDTYKKDIVYKRNLLDSELEELYGLQNTAFVDNKMQLDSAVYTTVLWTALASSIIYYVFIKL